MKITNKEKLNGIAINQDIPKSINLYTRQGKCETTLELIEYISTYNHTRFKYKVNASYPYTLFGEPDKYEAIDFSEGPVVCIGDCFFKMKVISIDRNYILCEKIF